MRVTRDCSKIFAPRATAARASPSVALYGSTLALPCVTRPKPFAPIWRKSGVPFIDGDVEAGLAPRAVLLLKRLNAVRARAEMDGVANLKAALDAQPLQRRDVLERATARDLIDVARIAHAMLFGQLVEERLGLVHHDAGCATRLRVGEAALLEDRDVDSSSREHIRRRAAQRSAADDGHFGLQGAAMPRVRRPPG